MPEHLWIFAVKSVVRPSTVRNSNPIYDIERAVIYVGKVRRNQSYEACQNAIQQKFPGDYNWTYDVVLGKDEMLQIHQGIIETLLDPDTATFNEA